MRILVHTVVFNSVLTFLSGSFAQQSVTFPLRPTTMDEQGGLLPIAVDYHAPEVDPVNEGTMYSGCTTS